jgi:hypothetical protein
MGEYRLYCLNDRGRLGLAELIPADSDEEAVSKARELKANAQKCEVWCENRLVAALNAADLTFQA